KPVHRRILYAMYRMRLSPDGRHRKSAAVVGDVLGKYHPHGDQAAYDTLVRMAQDFSMRYPLIDGQGNFGSIDGDSAAAMRYTEAKLTPIAVELLREIEQETVPYRANYDATLQEPSYLPSRIPNLLINGSSGIAVGMATNIPPHNLGEVIDALIAMMDKPDLKTSAILKYIKGPDFPGGATMHISKRELSGIYDEGRGPVKLRGEYAVETLKRGRRQIVITSLPYAVNKAKLVEKIASFIIEKKLPALHDVRDESTEIIRVVIELKGGVDIPKVMAFIFRYTDLETNFSMNLTALDPGGKPRRMTLCEMLSIFNDFRIEITGRRLKYDLAKIMERLHILRGLLKVLGKLDEAIKIIRKSKMRDEAKQKLKKRFRLDDVQASAVLDLRLSALVSIELRGIKLEAAELEARREMIESILKSKRKIKGVVKKELQDIKKLYGDKRKTAVVATAAEDEEFTADDFIEHEACYVIVSRNGWARRIKSEPNGSQLRFKEGDSLLKIMEADTSEHIGIFSSAGKVYVMRAIDLPQTSGFGDPIQAMFKFGDGERIVAVDHFPHIKEEEEIDDEFLAITENGQGIRFGASSVRQTTKAGKRYANVKGDDAVIDVLHLRKRLIYAAHGGGKGLLFKLKEVPLLSGPGSGVKLIKLKKGERVISVKNIDKNDSLRFVFASGRDIITKVSAMETGKRASAGRVYGRPRKKLMGITVEG
ncbi:MAG: DNA topoisomerase IV subunit A, partial [Nitrospinota bacterium]